MKEELYNSISRAIRHLTTTDFCATETDISNLICFRSYERYISTTCDEDIFTSKGQKIWKILGEYALMI